MKGELKKMSDAEYIGRKYGKRVMYDLAKDSLKEYYAALKTYGEEKTWMPKIGLIPSTVRIDSLKEKYVFYREAYLSQQGKRELPDPEEVFK